MLSVIVHFTHLISHVCKSVTHFVPNRSLSREQANVGLGTSVNTKQTEEKTNIHLKKSYVDSCLVLNYTI